MVPMAGRDRAGTCQELGSVHGQFVGRREGTHQPDYVAPGAFSLIVPMNCKSDVHGDPFSRSASCEKTRREA